MLQAPANDHKTKTEARSKTVEHLPEQGGMVQSRQTKSLHERDRLSALQKTYGNQSVLRMQQARSPAQIPVTASPLSRGSILQRKCACGNAVGSSGTCTTCQEKGGMALPGNIQTKLTINQPGDRYEQEADRIAEQVMRKPDSSLQHQVEPEVKEEKEIIQTKAIAQQDTSQVPPIVHEVLNSSGQHLDPETRTFMESHFGHDFNQVRVHTNAKAAESARTVNALAYTVRNNIVFNSGQYRPETEAGKKLLAHELTHTIQQGVSQSVVQRKLDKITQSDCKFTFELGIGIYGSRANGALATLWQDRINNRWSTDIVCASNGNRCPVTMKSTVKAYPSKNWSWQVPESNAVYVEELGYRDISAPLYKHWAEDADELTVVHETGHLMGLYDLYFGKYTLPGFENDIMGNYYTDPGPTQFSGALASILFNHKKGCPCCFGTKKSESSVESNENNQDSATV